MVKSRNIIFLNRFEKQGHNIVKYIRIKSPQNAEKFKRQILLQIEAIKQNPKLFPKEKYLYTKRGLYRFSLVMKSWKIIYKVTNSKIIFLGIIHTAQHPSKIKKLRTKL